MVEKMVFEVNSKLTKELIEKYDDDRGIFYRFQNPAYAIEGEYTQSWGMIFSSPEEAIADAEWEGWENPEDAVLPGKSCWDTFQHLMRTDTIFQFSDSDVLLVFEGCDTGAEGHDGEYVAEYIAPVAVFSMQDVIEFYNTNY